VWHLKADNAECVATHSILPPRKDYASDGLGLCWPAWRYDGKEFALPVGEGTLSRGWVPNLVSRADP
jgi:hypothetical protein